MKWKKKDGASTIEEVVLRNTGYSSVEELFATETKDYNIDYLDKAAEMINDAIVKKIPIKVIGDYDVDGIASSLILWYVIDYLGGVISVRIPKRFSEGYGVHQNIIDEIDEGMIITVDNGIVAFDAIQRAKDKGLKVIVTDHHLPSADGKLPNADVIIDPHIPGTADFEHYCGAGIAYKLIQKLTDNQKIIDKMSCFAAIGTICDVMPLIEENRAIVKKGLKNMVIYGNRTNGLYSLLRDKQVDRRITEEDIAFKIGPTINAAGRMLDDGGELAFKLLSYDGPFVDHYCQELIDLNEERKSLQAKSFDAVMKTITDNCMQYEYPINVFQENIHEGIIGIIAGKVAEKFGVPTFIFTNSEKENVLKGSARSDGKLHLRNLLDEVNNKDSSVFVAYGGHEAAAGLSVYEDKFDDYVLLTQEIASKDETEETEEYLEYDLEIDASQIADTYEQLQKYGPFGEGNNKIIFKINGFNLSPRGSSYFEIYKESSSIKLFSVNCSAFSSEITDKFLSFDEPKEMNLVGYISYTQSFSHGEHLIRCSDFEKVVKAKTRSPLSEAIRKRSLERHV